MHAIIPSSVVYLYEPLKSEKDIICVVDLCVIKKDDQGNVTALELSELSGEEAAEPGLLAGNLMGLIAEEELEMVKQNA